MTDGPPEPVLALVEERSRRRAEREFTAADELRDRLRGMGWEVVDGPRGSSVRPVLSPAGPGQARPLDEPATVDVSVQVVAEDHPADLRRCLDGLRRHRPPGISAELVVVANAPSFEVESAVADADAIVLTAVARLGYADARNLGLRESRGSITLLLDTSLEPVGDVLSPLLAAFEDPAVGLAGGWGLRSADGRQFDEAPPGPVDAVEGYCLAARRAVLRGAGLFDPRFRFYRNADLDFSFQARAAGWSAVRVAGLPIVRHEHRGYASLPPDERNRLSRRNFYLFWRRWGDRRDLLGDPPRR